MSVLDRIGLAPKPGRRPRRTGFKLESRAAHRQRLTARELTERAALFVGLVVLTLLAFPRLVVYEDVPQVGDVWRSDDVVAPFNFPIRLSEMELARRRDSVRVQEPPVFVGVPDALARTEVRLDSLALGLDSAFAAYGAWQDALARGRVARADSARFAARRAATGLSLSEDQWRALLASYAARARTLPAPTRPETGPALDDRLLDAVLRAARPLLNRQVLNIPLDSVRAEQLIVRSPDPRDRDEQLIQKVEVLGLDGAYALARRSLSEQFTEDTLGIAMGFFRAAFQPSLVYLRAETTRRLAERMGTINPTRGLIKQGMIIVRRGDVVTPTVAQQLGSLAYAQRERAGEMSAYNGLIGKVLLVTAALTIFFLYLFLLRRTVFVRFRHLLVIAILFAGTIVGYAIAVRVDGIGEMAVPVALTSILLTILFDSRVGMFATLALALVGGLIFGFDFAFTFSTLFGCTVAVFSVRDVKNRSQLILSSFLVFGAYVAVLTGYTLLRADPFDRAYFVDLVNALINASLLLSVPLLLLAFERGFGITTDLTLLELSDTNRPLLKELSLRAPGTFNHVLQVANLAEAAADTVGANALRARVGALYHDIGKMVHPEFYIENQGQGQNPHDQLLPERSAEILCAHVTDGLALGKEHRLPRVVLDFIATHHGTGLIEFFYRRAQERSLDGPPDEAKFRYPGPRPNSTEQAIVMLADSVEAASRSLQKPTIKRLDALINSIFRARVDDGQLDESALTFGDLTKIRETFLALLGGIYHSRVRYPDQEPEDDEPGGDGVADETVPTGGPSSRERSTLG